MKNLLFLILIVLCSCKKDSTKPTVQDDTILYKKFDPQVTLSSVAYYYWPQNANPYCRALPYPQDSSCSFLIDINDDSINDFKISASHSLFVNSSGRYCGHCGTLFDYLTSIAPLSQNDLITFRNHNLQQFSLGETISNELFFVNRSVSLSLIQNCGAPSYELSDSYIGFKHNDHYGWIHISPDDNYGITILECAINREKNKSILAGQKK